ncbi:proprotein convertase P-domain-containing protein [bacterium]|nr:proprotein convertase P-domain-containing protein [bacterium]
MLDGVSAFRRSYRRNGTLWAIATDGILPTSGTANVSERATEIAEHGISIFVDTIAPEIMFAAANPFAATSASQRSITLTMVVCDEGTGVDANAAIALTAAPKTVAAVDINKRVPPTGTSGTTLSKLAVPLVGTIGTISIDVNITHTYRGDLALYLTSPGGTVYQFKTSNGADDADDVIGSFDVTAGFAGEEAHGTWTLTINDVFFLDSGWLNSWSLTFTGAVTQVVTADPDYQAIDLGNPDPAPMAANFLATSATCATYTLTFNLPILLPTEGLLPLDIATADLGGCTVAATVTSVDGFVLMIDNTAPAPNLPDPDPLAVDPNNIDYPADDTIVQLLGAPGPFDWDYDDPATWTDNELTNPNGWDQHAFLNSAAVRLAASQPLVLAGKLLVSGQARDNSGVVQSGVQEVAMFWTYGSPNTPPPASAFTNQVPETKQNLTPMSNAAAPYSTFFNASSIVGTFYIKTRTTDYAGNVLDPIFGPFLGVDVMAPEAITWLRATVHRGSSDVLLDWHLGGHAPDNVVTVGYEIYRTKFAIQDLFGLTPADFDLIDVIDATSPINGQDVYTYLDTIPGAGVYGYYIVGFDAAGNGRAGSMIPGNPSNRVAAMKNDIVDPLPVNNLRVVGNQPLTTVRLSWSIPDNPLTLAPFDGDNVGIAQFKIYRKQQQVPLTDGDPDDLDGDLVPANLVGVVVNNYLPNKIVGERASLNGANTAELVVMSPPVAATAVTRVYNQRLGALYNVVSVVDRTITVSAGPGASLPAATDTVLVDYETFDRVFWDDAVSPGRHYAYAVIAQDAAENNSDISGLAEDSTGAALDTTPPEAITQLAVTGYVGNSTLTLEWPVTPYDNVAVMGYNILTSTAPIFDTNNPGKDSRVLQLAGYPKVAYAAAATPSVVIDLSPGGVDFGTLVVTDLTNGATVPHQSDPGVNPAVDTYWTASLTGAVNTVTVYNIPAEALDVPVDDGSTYPANLSVAYFNPNEILYDAGTNTFREQLGFSFDPTTYWGTNVCLENEILYFVVMAVDPSGNQAPISNIASAQVTPVPPLAPIAYIEEVSPAKRYLPGVWVGGEDIVFATLADPVRDWDVVAIEVYSEDPGQLSFVNSATAPSADGWYEIPVGDNLYPKLFVIAVDCAGNRSEATVLFNDIVAPPAPIVDRAVYNPAPIADLIYGFATVDTVQVHLYNDSALEDLVAVAIPSSTGAWNFVIPDITPEFVFVTALDAASNESKATVIDVLPDPPLVVTDPRVLEIPPLRTRFIVYAGVVVTTGGPDRVQGTVSDPDVKRVNVPDEALVQLEFSGIPSATGWFDIPIGDNYLPVCWVVAVDSAGHRSAAVRLLNDIVAPPAPIISEIIFNATPTPDIIRGFVSLDTVTVNVYNDFPLYELIGSFAVVPGPNGAFEISIADITPEFVFTAALDSVSNESSPYISPVIPDAPVIATFPTVRQNPPIRFRCGALEGDNDYVIGYTNDPQVVKIEVYRDADLDWPGDLIATQVLAGTNYFNISIGDNLYPEVFVVAVDSQNHRSPAVRLTNDIVPPPVLEGITLELYEGNNPDYIPPRPDIVRGFSTADTTLVSLYKDPELTECIGEAVPANGQWSITATEDILFDFVFVSVHDDTVDGDGLRHHPSNESDDLSDETVPAERRAKRIRVPNSPPIVYSVEVTENLPGNQDTVKVTTQRGADPGWDPDTEVEVRVFSVMREGAPNVVTPFATLISDVRDIDTDLASNVYLAVDTQVLQLTQDGHTRVFFQAAGVNPRTLFFDHRYTGRLLLGGGDGQIRVVNVSGFVPGTPLGAGAVLASLNTGIAGDDLVGPVVDTANSSAAGLRLVYASRASGDIMQVDFNAVGNSFGAPSVRHAAGATGINSPQSLAFNLAGDLFVGDVVAGGGMANPGKDRVVRVRAASGRTTVMAKNLTLPSGMSIDVAGDLYINQLTPRNIGLRGEVVVYRPFETEVGATLLRSIHTTFEGQPLRPSVDPAGRMYFGSRTGANVSYVYQGVLSARFPWGPDSGSDGVPDAWGVPITPVQSPQSQTAPDGQITFNIGDNEHAQIAVIAVRRGGFSTGVPVLASNDIVEPQPPVAQVADATPPLQDSVTGYAERKSTVVVYGDPFGTNDLRSYNVGDSGAFIQLFLGNNYLPAYWIAAIDRAGNRSVLHQLETDIEIDVPRLDKLTVICNPPGQNDLVRGDPAAVEGWAWVRIYSNPELTHLVNSPVQAGADGSFLYNIGDNQVSDMWLIAVDVNGNVSRPVRLWNDTEGPSLNPAAIQVLAHEQGAQDFVIGLAGAVEAGATVQAWLDAGLTMPAPDPIAVAGLDGAFGTLNMGDDSSPIIEMTGTAPFQTPRRSFFLRAKDACGNPGPVLELDNPFVAGDSPVDIDKIIVHSRETLLTDSVEGIYGAVEPFATVQVYYDVFFTQPVMVGAVHAATSADQWGQFGPIDLGDDLAAAFFLKVTDAYGNVSAPVKIYNPFVPGISEVDPSRIIVFSNQNGIDDFVIGIAGAVEPRAAVAIFYDAAFSNPVPGAVATADDHGAFGPISLGNDLATQFYLRAIDEIGHISSPYLLLNPYVENPVDVNPSLIEVTSNEELVDDWILGKSGAVEPRGRVLIFKTIGDATAIAEDPVTHVVLESVPGVVARAFRSTTANDFGGFGPVNVGDDESDVFYLRVIDETNHISSPLLLRNPLVPGVVDVDPFRIRVVANQEGLDDYIVGDSGAVEPFSGVEVFTSDWSIAPATPVRTGSVDQYGRFTINIGDDEFRVGDELETEFWLRFTDPIGHLSAPYRVVNPFILGTQRPDVMRIRVISNPEGQDDLVVGVDGAVEANAEVRIYSDAGLTHLVAVTQADMWGAFGPVSVGDDVSTVFYLVAIDNLGNQSSPLRLLNPFVPNNPQATSFGFVVLDGFGGVHTRNVYDSLSNAAHQNVGVPYPLPIFSAIAPVLDGFFALRGDGVIEALGNAPLVDQVSMPNYPMLFTGDFTRGVDIQAYEDSSGGARGMYVVDAYGEVFTSRVYGVEYVRSLSEPPLYYDRVVRAMQLVRDEYGDPVGTLVMDRNGMITARGGGAFSDAVSAALGQHLMHGMAVAFDVKTDANHTVTGLLVLGENGDVVAVGDAPDVATRPAIAGGLARDIEIDPTGRGYYILDGLGGILTVGDITPLEGAPYFGFDIARDLDVVHARGGRDIDMPPYPYPEEAGQ